MCVLGVSILSLATILILDMEMSDSVVFFVFLFIKSNVCIYEL